MLNNDTKKYNEKTLVEAIKNTFKKRNTNLDINEIKKTIELIKTDRVLKRSWINYQQKFNWAGIITYELIIEKLENLILLLEDNI